MEISSRIIFKKIMLFILLMEDYCFNQFSEKFSEFIYNLNNTFKDDEELIEFNKKTSFGKPEEIN